jgi:hypothetical protein
MKRILFALWLLAVPAFAQNRIPAAMVKINTVGLTRFVAMTNVQDVVNNLDVLPAAVYLAITNAEVYVTARTTTNATVSLVTPRYVGDSLLVITASTNLFYTAAGVTTNSWKKIYAGVP